jgi:hypothetical protein
MKDKFPYLENKFRLADIIAALQILGSYTWASREWDNWEKKLDKPKSAENWKIIFIEHPEFFRVSPPDKTTNKEWVSLRWRHGYDRNFDIEQGRELSKSEIDALGESMSEQQLNQRLTRKTLTAEQIESLINTAIELHERTIAHKEEKRWFIPLLFGLVGIIIGAILQAALK